MLAFGSDRVRRGDGEQMILLSTRDKGWTARVPKTLTTAEHPGIAVLWEERYFEVVSATSAGQSVRYVLEPWRDNHAIRLTDAYDEASEAAREAEHLAGVRRTRNRTAANLLGIFTGHLPAAVQETMGSELGILPTRLTALSLLVPMTFIGFVVYENVERLVAQQPGVPMWLLLLCGYLGAESAGRFSLVWSQNRPVGSLAGWLLYSFFYLLSPNRKGMPAPLIVNAPPPALQREAPAADILLQDSISMREPLLTLLTPQEQQNLARRYGYDYRRLSWKVAAVLLVFASAGVVSSWVRFRNGADLSLISMLVAAVVALEQVVRLRSFSRGPAGSVLGFLARPFVRKLL